MKGPTLGHSISSNIHIRKRKSQEKWTGIIEKAYGADTKLGKKGEKTERNLWESMSP